jgi:pilus assembly protein CpaC
VYLAGAVSSDGAADQALKMAANYSKEVISSLQVVQHHLKQVQLNVRIAEVDRTKLAQFGINLFSNGKTAGATSTQQFGLPAILNGVIQPSDLLNLFVYNSDINLGLILKDLQQRQVLQILAEPNITSLSGQPARFLSGGEFPFPVVQGTSGAFASITVQFRPFGVKLEFTPLVNGDGSIRLKVAPEVSALDYTNAVTISGYTIPAISTRRAETEIELRDGQSFAISGLLDHRTTQKLSHMPGIGDIPILGEFFHSKETNLTVTELIVIVTPSIVDPLAIPVEVPPLPTEVIPDLETKGFDRAVKSESKLPK